MNTVEIGLLQEMKTVFYLQELGWGVLKTNWRRNWGELDIVAYEKWTDTLVIVEVKARRTEGPASDLELISKIKRRRLERTAQSFLAESHLDWGRNKGFSDQTNIRFDLVVWRGEGLDDMRHYPDVF